MDVFFLCAIKAEVEDGQAPQARDQSSHRVGEEDPGKFGLDPRGFVIPGVVRRRLSAASTPENEEPGK